MGQGEESVLRRVDDERETVGLEPTDDFLARTVAVGPPNNRGLTY